jgi:hypothetical protein
MIGSSASAWWRPRGLLAAPPLSPRVKEGPARLLQSDRGRAALKTGRPQASRYPVGVGGRRWPLKRSRWGSPASRFRRESAAELLSAENPSACGPPPRLPAPRDHSYRRGARPDTTARNHARLPAASTVSASPARNSENPSLARAAACLLFSGVIRLRAPISSSFPQRPRLERSFFHRSYCASVTTCVAAVWDHNLPRGTPTINKASKPCANAGTFSSLAVQLWGTRTFGCCSSNSSRLNVSETQRCHLVNCVTQLDLLSAPARRLLAGLAGNPW